MLSTNNSIKICLAKTNKPATERIMAKLSGESGFRMTVAMPVTINKKKIMGLKMNKAISGIAILFGRERCLFKISFKHLAHKPIN